ncbi:MAG TPA: ATP-binding protein [Myxococcales bacterium LLY-WYZ-16_1]|nr:ATP-binding protein [Myxococcales bacterium LLY-WYZ-16_1]
MSSADTRLVRRLVEHSGDAFAFFGPDGTLLELHDPTGRRWPEHPPRPPCSWTDLAEPELIPAYRELWQRALEDGGSEWVTGAGGQVWRDALVPIRRDDQTLEGILFVARNDSARHEIEAALRESERRFRVLAEQADFGIGLFDDRGLVYANRTLQSLFSVDPENVAAGSKELLGHVNSDDAGKLERLWKPSSDKPVRPERMTVRVHAPDGSERWVDVAVRSIVLSDNRFVLTSCSDITGREQLLQAVSRKEREASLIAIAGGLAHDFNNILVSILSATSMLQDELPADRNLQDLCAMISGGAERIASLTGKLLTYSRGGVFRPERLDLNDVVRDAIEMTRSSLEHVQVNQDLRATHAIRGDRSLLQQVLVSLLVNAGEATAGREGRVHVRTADEDRPAPEPSTVRLEVEDDGAGMDAQTQQRMFEPYFSTKFQGRGLGLAAAVGAIRTHGGRVDVESAPGQGTQVVIHLPLEATEAFSKVLVVDPDPMVRKVVERLLRRRGIHATPAEDAATALERLDQPDAGIRCVMTDATLPDLRAPEFLRALRNLAPSLPILVCSGHPKDVALDGIDEGVLFGFLMKPFKSEELLRLVRKALAE